MSFFGVQSIIINIKCRRVACTVKKVLSNSPGLVDFPVGPLGSMAGESCGPQKSVHDTHDTAGYNTSRVPESIVPTLLFYNR